MMLTKKQLKDLTDDRLLAYLKAERIRFHKAGYVCSCCGEILTKDDQAKYNKHRAYLNTIIGELKSRQTIAKEQKV